MDADFGVFDWDTYTADQLLLLIPTTSNVETNVRIEWGEIAYMLGYEYRIEIMGSDGNYYEDEHLGIERGCGVTTKSSCQIMTGVLGEEPYNLA
jgi:hypothetical protein